MGGFIHLDSIDSIDSSNNLTIFLSEFTCLPTSARPNTLILFPLVDASKPRLLRSPSPFIIHAWSRLLLQYPNQDLRIHLVILLRFGCLLGYTGPNTFMLSSNLPSALIDPSVIDEKLSQDLSTRRVVEVVDPVSPFITSPLGLVPKHDGGLRKIHHLSYPKGTSVNDYIAAEASALSYTSLQRIFEKVLKAGRHSVLIKRDVKDAFQNIPVAPHMQWLLGFLWKERYYQETCLPFGLSTSPFIFNLLAEAFDWILEAYFQWSVDHYLDDFIATFSALEATPSNVIEYDYQYRRVTDLLGIPRQESKDQMGTIVPVFGILVNTNTFVASLPLEKISKAIEVTTKALAQKSLTLREAQSLTGYLSYCAKVVRLGWVMHPLWNFVASYPQNVSLSERRRLPLQVQNDLTWWSTLLPIFNGILFFDDPTREVFQLYTNASLIGLGGFFFSGFYPTWPDVVVSQADAFIAKTSNFRDTASTITPAPTPDSTQSASTSAALALPLANSTQSNPSAFTLAAPLLPSINVFEVEALLLAFQLSAYKWSKTHLIVFINSTTAYSGLKTTRLRGPSNIPLRKLMFLAAKYDILLEPRWIKSEANGLADALSRFDEEAIANLCSHWQNPLSSMLHLSPG